MPSDPLAHEIEILEALIQIRGRQAELQACCDRAEANERDVSPAVFTRVMADYRDRLQALDTEAMPLKVQAREAHVALKASYAEVRQANEQAASEREELIFRHKVGEFDQGVLDSRITHPEQRLAECADALAALEQRRARFLEAFGSEEHLESFMGATAKAPPPPPEPPPVPTVMTPSPEVQIPVEAPRSDVAPSPPEAATRAVVIQVDGRVPAADTGDGTRLVALDAMGNFLTPDADPAPADRQSESGEARTMILPGATLVVRLKGETAREYPVSPITTIGRSDQNSVCIPRRNVSREHAAIHAAPAGFTLKDLGSQNGTLVNGDTITDRLLQDGDLIVIGDAQIDFRVLVHSAM